MSRYTRPQAPGATVFFTVTLMDRGSDVLVRHVDMLRCVARLTKADKPFGIEAWVVLPDHMHFVWTLPEGDADYSNRVGMLKARFSRELGKSGRSGVTPTPAPNAHGAMAGRAREVDARVTVKEAESRGIPRPTRSESTLWQKRFWEHHIRDEADFRAHLRYCWINPVKHGWWSGWRIGRIRHFTAMRGGIRIWGCRSGDSPLRR